MAVRGASITPTVGTAEAIAGTDTTEGGFESLPKVPDGRSSPENGSASAVFGKDATDRVLPQPCNNPSAAQRQPNKVAESRVDNRDALCIAIRKKSTSIFKDEHGKFAAGSRKVQTGSTDRKR